MTGFITPAESFDHLQF